MYCQKKEASRHSLPGDFKPKPYHNQQVLLSLPVKQRCANWYKCKYMYRPTPALCR